MSDNEDDFGGSDAVYKPSFVLIAIDSDPSMFVKKESDGTTPFKSCINACYNLANSLIFTRNKRSWSPFSMALACEDAKASLVDFNDNILNSIKNLKGKSELSEEKLRDLHQRKESLDLSAFFLFCKKKFKSVNSVFYKRTIIFITNDDNPTRGDKNQNFAAFNEAKNFEANNINFEMVTMNENFDYKIFYNELFSVMKVPLVETIVEDEDGLLEKLSSSVLVKYFQRKMCFFPFINDQARFLKVRQKSYIKEEKLYNNAYVSESGKLLKKIPKSSADVSKKYKLDCNLGQIEFSQEEHFELTNDAVPVGYTLLHVSDRVSDIGIVLTNMLILEVDNKEELTFFNSFWQYCVDKNKVLVCLGKLRQQGKTRFVELIPKFANNSRIFIVKAIPFGDEHKHPPTKLATDENMDGEYSAEKIKVTNSLIDNLTFDYDPKMFTNPALIKKKAFLRSKFLDQPQEDVEDVTLDSAGIDDSLGVIGKQFKELFNLEEQETGKKRKAPAARGRSKKVK